MYSKLLCWRFDFFFFSFWVFKRGKQIQFFNQSFHKEIYNTNVLKHKLIQWQTPFLLKCANKVDPFSKALFLGGFCNEFTSFTGTEPCSCGNHRAEYIHCFIWPSASGLNWDLGWWANDWTAMPKKKLGKKERKKEIKKKKRKGCFYNAKWSIILNDLSGSGNSYLRACQSWSAASQHLCVNEQQHPPADSSHITHLPRKQWPHTIKLTTEILNWNYLQG